jgi:CRISPR-associated endonuclease/helicase Cas3
MMNPQGLVAHIQKEGETWRFHALNDHLHGVAHLARSFASPFGNGDWAEVAGQLHDLGKASTEFQTYIRKESGFDTSLADAPGKVVHSIQGAKWAVEKWGLIGKLLAYLIAGHHGGLPDWYGGLENRLNQNDLVNVPMLSKDLEASLTGFLAPPNSTPASRRIDPRQTHLWLRMLFSCLVDADFLDTESFMGADKAEARNQHEPLEVLKRKFDAYMVNKAANASPTDMNCLREQVLTQCRQAGQRESGYFTLTVPTGGGKTLSALAFALEHALKHGKRRVIFTIPYTSIIEQTSKVYQEIFGIENVVEHHSALDPDKESLQNRLASENWDAPIIVTTNVQLFESLFASRPGACRKLHNLADAVVVLDEAQMLPPEHLEPIIKVVRGLKDYFGTTFVLCTATQPALTGRIGSGEAEIEGLGATEGEVTEIIANPEALFQRLNRVDVEQRPGKVKWGELAEELTGHEQVLCIVNTRRACQELHSHMPEGTIHLSANMCAAHRSLVITGIKERLKLREPVRVISTQLVEAGVDLDFPVVYRAMAGLDSIAQAAGRCNREGLLEKGKVVVFEAPESSPPGLLKKGEDACREMLNLHGGSFDISTPNLFSEYFKIFYARLNSFDTKGMKSFLETDAHNLKFSFATAAKEFKLIEDQQQQAVIVDWHHEKSESHKLINDLRFRGPSRGLLRQLQRYTINLPRRIFEKHQSFFDETQGYWCLSGTGSYDGTLGFIGANVDAGVFIQ